MDIFDFSSLFGVVLIAISVFFFVRSRKNKETFKTSVPQKNKMGGLPQTPVLNNFSVDFTELARVKKIDPVVGRDEEIRKLTQTLVRRSKNNAILIGSAGVGKTAIVEGLAVKIASGDVPKALKDKRLFALDVAILLSDTKYRGEFEKRIKKIVEEIKIANRSIILFVDEIHSIVQSHGTEGSVNLADMLKPALARGELQMIGATTTDEYNEYIASVPSLSRRFQPIDVFEPSIEESVEILKGVQDKYRTYHKVEFTDAALRVAVELTHKRIPTRQLPDKAIDAIDEAGAMINVAHVHENISPLLFEVALAQHPECAKLWKQIQELDTKLVGKSKNTIALKKKREGYEKKIEGLGVVSVDSSDIQKVVDGWMSKT